VRAVIPAAGAGKRLKPSTLVRPKPMVHVACKPIIGHILDSLARTEIQEVVFVVGFKRKIIEDYARRAFGDRFSLHFVYQKERLGLGHAIYCASEFLDGEPVLISLGDGIFEKEYSEMIAEHERLLPPKSGSLAVRSVKNPEKYGIAITKDNGSIERLVEKPQVSPSNLAIAGVYIVEDSLALRDGLNAMMNTRPGRGGEFQLTDALQVMIDRGAVLKTIDSGHWFDCGLTSSLLEANRALLVRMFHNGVRNEGNGTILGGQLIQPVGIESNCIITNSIIGPFVSIAEGVIIENSIVRNSIVNQRAHLKDVNVQDTVVGEFASVRGRPHELNVGDYSSLTL